jgi:ferredoxin--NADP+ reductase
MTTATATKKSPRDKFHAVSVTYVYHATDRVFLLRTTRPDSFRFEAGEFTMLGLDTGQKIVQRAYSMINATYDEELGFLSIKVPDGEFTTLLQKVQEGDELLIGRKPTGTLTLDAVAPGRVLYLFSTGTGIAPFISLIQEPEIYNRYEKIVLNHTCRYKGDLVFDDFLRREMPEHPLVGEEAAEQLLYYPTVTREPYERAGRVTEHLASGQLQRELGLPAMEHGRDKAMICGSPGMLETVQASLQSMGFQPGDRGEAGDYSIEKAFVG